MKKILLVMFVLTSSLYAMETPGPGEKKPTQEIKEATKKKVPKLKKINFEFYAKGLQTNKLTFDQLAKNLDKMPKDLAQELIHTLILSSTTLDIDKKYDLAEFWKEYAEQKGWKQERAIGEFLSVVIGLNETYFKKNPTALIAENVISLTYNLLFFSTIYFIDKVDTAFNFIKVAQANGLKQAEQVVTFFYENGMEIESHKIQSYFLEHDSSSITYHIWFILDELIDKNFDKKFAEEFGHIVISFLYDKLNNQTFKFKYYGYDHDAVTLLDLVIFEKNRLSQMLQPGFEVEYSEERKADMNKRLQFWQKMEKLLKEYGAIAKVKK